MKPIYKRRTFWAGILLALINFGEAIAGILSPEGKVILLAASGFIGAVVVLLQVDDSRKSSRRGSLPLGADGAAVAGDPATPARRQFGGPSKPHSVKPKG